MLPELILREEKEENFSVLVLLGGLSVLLGFLIARVAFPSEADLLTVFFAAIPMIYPLVSFFLDDEKGGRPHREEVEVYGSIFAGAVFAFFLLGLVMPGEFGIQVSQFEPQLGQMGIENVGGSSVESPSGYSSNTISFVSILSNNLFVFTLILGVSTLIASSGAFILTWNASVLGIFLGVLARSMPSPYHVLAGTSEIAPPWAYLPHAAFEMTGFIIAGISGSLMSAALYRGHTDIQIWEDYSWLVFTGVSLIFFGAALESGSLKGLILGAGGIGATVYRSYRSSR